MQLIIDEFIKNALWVIGGIFVLVIMVGLVIVLLLRQTINIFKEEEVFDVTPYEDEDDYRW